MYCGYGVVFVTKKDLSAAVNELSAIPYFPQAHGAKLAIAVQLGRFVGNNRKLRWLIDSAINSMKEWRGVAELRGLYCTHYRPEDGKEATCALPGYTPEDNEAQNAQQIYSSPYKELAAGTPFQAEIKELVERKKL